MYYSSKKQLEHSKNYVCTSASDCSSSYLLGNQSMLNQCGLNPPIQRYYKDGKYRISDDKSLIVYENDPQKIAATPGKLNAANTILSQRLDRIHLVQIGALAKSNKILISASYNSKQYNKMAATSDCGEFSHLVTGNNNLHGRYQAMETPQATQVSADGNPRTYQSNVLDRLSEFLLKEASYAFIDKILIESRSFMSFLIDDCPNIKTLLSINARTILYEMPDADTYLNVNNHPVLQPDEAMTILTESFSARRLIWNRFISRYQNQLPHPPLLAALSQCSTLAMEFGVNASAAPRTGEGFVTVSGGAPFPDVDFTWDYHWSGVVMESDNGADHIVIENYASLIRNPLNPDDWIPEVNTNWNFSMHGIRKPGQSFHEHHLASKQHGETPLTLAVVDG